MPFVDELCILFVEIAEVAWPGSIQHSQNPDSIWWTCSGPSPCRACCGVWVSGAPIGEFYHDETVVGLISSRTIKKLQCVPPNWFSCKALRRGCPRPFWWGSQLEPSIHPSMYPLLISRDFLVARLPLSACISKCYEVYYGLLAVPCQITSLNGRGPQEKLRSLLSHTPSAGPALLHVTDALPCSAWWKVRSWFQVKQLDTAGL